MESGTPELRERWKRGVALVEGSVGEAVGKIYVEQYFSPTAKERMDHWSTTSSRPTAAPLPILTG